MDKSKVKGIIDFCIDYKERGNYSAIKREFSVASKMIGFMTMGSCYPYFELDEEDMDYLHNKYSKILKEQASEIAQK
jgi:hypothetical protein